MWSRRTIGEWVCAYGEAVESRNCLWELTAAQMIDLILSWSPHATQTQCLFSIRHGLRLTRCLIFIGYTHAFLVSGKLFCWFYQRPDVSVNNIRRVHRRSRWYINPLFVRTTFAVYHIYQPSVRAGYDTRSVSKRSLTGLNSEFSFS